LHPSAAALDQLVLADLSVATEARRFSHLRGCDRCRNAYDERISLHRALAGHPERPTRAEEERVVRRALAGAEFRLPRPQPEPRLADLLIWHPAVAAGAFAVLLVLVATGLRLGLRAAPPTPPPQLVAQAAVPAPDAFPVPAPVPAPPPAARLASARGALVNGRDATAGVELAAGSTLEVNRGVAELSVARGGTVRVFPETTLTVGADGERVQLSKGKVWCILDHNNRPFTVATSLGEARAVGTSFIVEQRGDEETDVRVLQGLVDVEDHDQLGLVHLHADQQTRLRASGAPTAPRRYAPAHDRSAWEEFFSSFIRTLKRIFGGR
jgi:hypothetical protein